MDQLEADMSKVEAARLQNTMQDLSALVQSLQRMGQEVLVGLGHVEVVEGLQKWSLEVASSCKGVVPPINAFPPWAARCVLVPVRPSNRTSTTPCHLEEQEILEGKRTPAYQLMAAARSHCIACIHRHLAQGHAVDLYSNSGWNAWDNAHYSHSKRRNDTLRYLEAAGLRASAKYRAYTERRVVSLKLIEITSPAIFPGVIPSLDGYPPWATSCPVAHLRTVDVEPGQVHLMEEQPVIEAVPRDFIIAAGRAGCLCCIRELLVLGHDIGATMSTGLNVWDIVHMIGGERKADMLRYIEQAGGRRSADRTFLGK